MKKKTRVLWLDKKILLIAAAAVVAAVLLLTLIPSAVSAWSAEKELPVYCVETNGEKLACLTFDAAWGNEDTQMLIDILGKYDVRATFFVVGDWVRKYPESVKALSDAGHEVMNHSDTHPHMASLSASEIISETESCNAEIAAVTGVTPTLIRVPYGEYNDTVITTLRSIGMQIVQWNLDSLDWKELSAPEITERILSDMVPGSIALFHNAAKNTPAALPGIIEALQADGYKLVPVSELLLTGDYTIDHAGKQIAN